MYKLLILGCLMELVQSVDHGYRKVPDNALQAMYPFYHTSADIEQKLVQLSTSCGVSMEVREESCGNNCRIQVVDLGPAAATQKIFLLFGEHARELISPETAVALIESLCGGATSSAALKHTRFRIIPNGNPVSRKKVEQGEFCLRTNQNGIDLNRNWPSHWQHDYGNELAENNPGAYPLSEPETRIFQHAVSSFDPTAFVAVHSGTMGMYMPWAFDKTADDKNIRNLHKMTHVLSELDDKFCQCPSGQAAKEVGYDSPGTCLDWVHSHTKSQYSFAFEIFTGVGNDDLRDRYEVQQKLRGGAASLLQLDQDYSNASCFLQFNPETLEQYKQVTNNWANALIEFATIAALK